MAMCHRVCVVAMLVFCLGPGRAAVEASYLARAEPGQVSALVSALPQPTAKGDLAPEYPVTADGLSAAWCGELLVIEPASDVAGLSALLPAEPVAGPDAPAELVRMIVAGPYQAPRLAELLTALALPDLHETARLADELRAGRAVVRADFRPLADRRPYSAPLMVRWPAHGPGDEAVTLRWRGADEPAREVGAERRGPDPDREAAVQPAPDWPAEALAGDAAPNPLLDRPVSLPKGVLTASQVLRHVAQQAGLQPLEAVPGDGPELVVEMRSVPAREVLPALERLTGWRIRVDGDRCTAAPGAGLRAQLAAATPLGWWAIGRLEPATLAETEPLQRRAAWAVLGAADRQACEAGARLSELSGPGREAVERLATPRLARRWAQSLASLPDPDGKLLCTLTYLTRNSSYHLRAPGWAQTVGGSVALELRTAAAGTTWIDLAGDKEARP